MKDDVRQVADEVRRFLEPRWDAWRRERGREISADAVSSFDMCRFSTAFLKEVLDREFDGMGMDWQRMGGTPDRDADVDPDYGTPGGYRDPASGTWHAHYWVTDGDYDLIVDVTADQFGGPPVFVGRDEFDSVQERVAFGRYRENYFEDAVDEHMRDVRERVAAWLDEWKDAHSYGWRDGYGTGIGR